MVWTMPMYPLLKTRVWVGAILCCFFVMLVSPKIPHSPKHYVYSDMRNFLGVPNTLNVISNFPFLIVGVLGFVLCLQGNLFCISSRSEIWGWVFFYTGITATAFGSAYYHLKPDNNRFMWDRLPMMVAYVSLLSCIIVERVGRKIGVSCLFSLLMLSLFGITCERNFDDLRLCMLFQLIPSVAIPAMALLFPPKYTHSKYWLWATGAYLIAEVEAAADRKIYGIDHYIISGHSLGHLFLVMVPVLFTVMLWFRSIRIPRLGELKERA